MAVQNLNLYLHWGLTRPSKPLQDWGQEIKILTEAKKQYLQIIF